MILAIDIGNTTVCTAGLEKTGAGEYEVLFSGKTDTEPGRSRDSYLCALRELLADAGVQAEALTGAIISSVVPALEDPLRYCARALTGTEPVLLTALCDTGLRIDLPEPEKVGRDRLADAAWAAARFPLPAVTVDLGTATTFNVIGEGAVFLGGVIAPGVAMGLRALSSHTAQLPDIPLETPGSVIGRTTAECMRSGLVAGTASMIDGITARIEQELGKPVTLVMTGGLARYVEPLCGHPHIYEPDLLLKGLALLYERNKGAC